MAKYVTLYTLTDQGVRAVKESPTRTKAAIKEAAKRGVKVLGVYYTQGPYDLVAISEAADENAAAAFALSVASLGNVRTSTMRAWDVDEFEGLVKLMG